MKFSATATYHYIKKNREKQLHILHTSYITDHKTNKLTLFSVKLISFTILSFSLQILLLFFVNHPLYFKYYPPLEDKV